jgi:putative membrane protein
MKTRLSTLCALAGGLCLLTAAAAQNLSKDDAEFLKKAAEGGQAEVQAAKMAESKGASAGVKSFASEMVADHTKSGEELKALAASKGVKLPSEPSKDQASKLGRLEKTQGESFDKRYTEDFGVEAHQDMLKLMKKGAKSKDAEVKAFAEKTAPTVEHHLGMAKTLKNSGGKPVARTPAAQ